MTKEIGIRLSVKDKDIAERALKQFGAEGEAALRRIHAAGAAPAVSLQALSVASGAARNGLKSLAGEGIAAITSMLSLAAAIAGTKAALDAFGDIADNAKASGLDVEFFQELAFGAELGGVGVDQLSAALDSFNKNSGLAVVNKGKMATALKALNPELLESIRNAKTQEERVRLAADAINDEADASRKAALAAALFGDAGVRMVEVFRGGSAALAETAAQARELGLVVDRDLIARAETLGDEFEIAAKVMDVNFKQALINLAPTIVWFVQLAGGIADAIRQITDAVQSLENQSTLRLEARIRTIGIERTQLEDERTRLQREQSQSFLGGGEYIPRISGVQGDIDKLSAEEKAILEILNSRATANKPPPAPTLPPPPPASGSDGAAKASLREAEALIKRLQTASEAYASTIDDLNGHLRAGRIDQATYNRALADAIVKRLDAAKGEAEFAGALEAANRARAAGVLSEENYTEAVEAMTERRLKAENSFQAGIQLGFLRLQQRSRNFGDDIGDSLVSGVERFEDALVDAVQTGKIEFGSLADAIAADLIRLSVRKGITDPLASVIGNLVGAAFGGAGGGASAATSLIPGLGGLKLNARGDTYSHPSLSAYSNQVLDKPTPFLFARGAGLMAEDKPEAILPLIRDSLGNLGVRSSGDGQAVVKHETNIINNAGVEVESGPVQQTAGGTRQDIQINRAVAKAISTPGPANRAVRGVGRLVRR